MSNRINEMLTNFVDDYCVAFDTADGKHTSIRLPAVLCEAARRFCHERGFTRNDLVRMIDARRPADLLRTEAVRTVFYQIYFNPEGVKFDD